MLGHRINGFQLTAARRRLDNLLGAGSAAQMFQLTAARRRLGLFELAAITVYYVSTHSRPKAAGLLGLLQKLIQNRFQLTAARRRLGPEPMARKAIKAFQLTAARRRLG